ncbi:hypothetical protein B0T10DRAFT_580315 [Thelonectria olida]|uniref:Uncharacterized protein n=1 Tax=Thelonectria olida TaxID=1576542 RepID=A0A9P8W001_9HYPO|nr:hypothetical protein B0T10DRAFT_580315 [Thelonectria olida]
MTETTPLFSPTRSKVVCNARGRWDTITKEWNAHRIPNTSLQPLAAYVGKYYNDGIAMSLRVIRTGDDSYPLRFCVNGIEEQVFELYSQLEMHALRTDIPCICSAGNRGSSNLTRWTMANFGRSTLNSAQKKGNPLKTKGFGDHYIVIKMRGPIRIVREGHRAANIANHSRTAEESN